MSDYDLMRLSDTCEEDGLEEDEIQHSNQKTQKEKYFEYYDDIKLTPKDDW